MVASATIIAISAILFLYWFRYTCLLILDGRPQSGDLATRIRLNYCNIPQVLSMRQDAQSLAGLCRRLDDDYQLLTAMLQQIPAADSTDRRLLQAYYRGLRVLCRVTRRASPAQATRCLREMARVLDYFAGAIARPVEA